jgi:hypothetical protein
LKFQASSPQAGLSTIRFYFVDQFDYFYRPRWSIYKINESTAVVKHEIMQVAVITPSIKEALINACH